MYLHYRSSTVSDEELDRMTAQADAEKNDPWPQFVVVEDMDVVDDDTIDDRIAYVLDRLADSDEDERWRREHGLPICGANLDGHDLLRAADECGLVLGTVFDSAHRFDMVVALDDDACTDAAAWATTAQLPGWVLERYRKLVVKEFAESFAAIMVSNEAPLLSDRSAW